MDPDETETPEIPSERVCTPPTGPRFHLFLGHGPWGEAGAAIEVAEPRAARWLLLHLGSLGQGCTLLDRHTRCEYEAHNGQIRERQ